MKGDFHVRFRENVRVKFPCVTRLVSMLSDNHVKTKNHVIQEENEKKNL